MLALVEYYGVKRWLKDIQTHFWLTSRTKSYYLSLGEKMRTRGIVTFYYPCSKYPQHVSITSDSSLATPESPPSSLICTVLPTQLTGLKEQRRSCFQTTTCL